MKPIVCIKDDKVVLTSRDLATTFEKDHDKVRRDIEREIEYIKQSPSNQDTAKFGDISEHFIKTTYVDDGGRTRKMYELTQKGFLTVAMKYEGDKAAALRWQILSEYEEKERELQALRADRFAELCRQEWQASLPDYHKFTDEIKALIEYAVVNGADRQDIDPHYYKAFNAAVNRELGIKNERRPYLTPTATVHIRNINKIVKKTIRNGIAHNQKFELVLADALDSIVDYAADTIDADERRRIAEFADENIQQHKVQRAIDKVRRGIAQKYHRHDYRIYR